jgi:LacI family transcriptional regulator, galactose operon repressor
MATIYDVAERAGVSIATVSAVINRSAYVSPELTKRVNQAIQELDYTINQVAHALQTRRTRTIGMLIPDTGAPDPFYGQVVRGAEDVLRRRGYLLFLGHTYNSVAEQTRYLSAFRARLVDGVLLFQAPGEDKELERLIESKKPLVFVGRVPKDVDADVVATDIQAGTRMAIDHLLIQGHRRIGMVLVSASMSVHANRIAGWRAALRKHGVQRDESYLVSGELSSDAGARGTDRLLGLPDPPTAIFTDNLVLTTGVLKVLKQRGIKCPGEMLLASSDDAEFLDVFQPPITTIVQPSYKLGEEAAELLLQRIRFPKRLYKKHILKPELRVRG